MRQITINIKQEHADRLQRLGYEVDSKVFLIDRMFANHAQDTDTSMFESVPFRHFFSEYEKARVALETAKSEFQRGFLEPRVKEILKTDEHIEFSWMIDDFTTLQCEVTVVE